MSLRLPVVSVPFALDAARAPEVPLSALDTVWFQLAGTRCNLACRHCFVSCGPEEDREPMMAAADVRRFLAEAEGLGARDYYFTGGEPMLHPDFWPLCEEALARGPLTVLTNGLLFDAAAARRARALFDAAPYSFDLRLSLDGMSAEENDPVRGRDSFAQVTRALGELAAVGLSPAITVVEHRAGMAAAAARARFLAFARSLGLARARVKFLQLLRIGREERRSHGYDADDLGALVDATLAAEVEEQLVCSSSRLVSARGVITCPILLDAPGALLGRTLAETLAPIRLRWAACKTCVVDGLTCRT